MRVITTLIVTTFLFGNAIAQQSIQNQMNAINAAQSEIKVAEEAKRREYYRQQEQRAAEERFRRTEEQARLQKQREEEDARRRAVQDKADALAKAQRDQAYKEKQRNQSYEDELRKMSIEEKQLELQTKKAKVKRADDYIDQELNREKARTDVIQSEADATRNVSTGAKNMMSGIGKGEENKTKGWSLFKKN